MSTLALQQRLLTVDEYHAMADAGILGEEDRVELIVSLRTSGSAGHGSRVMGC